MDWLCPSYSETLSRQLNKHYGNITVENVIRDITAITQTGNLQIAIYDLTNNFAYLANAKSTNETGPLYAYERYVLWITNQPMRLDRCMIMKGMYCKSQINQSDCP